MTNFPSLVIKKATPPPVFQQVARLKQKSRIQIDYFYVSFLTALILFCLQTNIYAADSIEKVLISADHMHLNIKSGHSVYTGNVRISQGKMVLTGDEVTLEQKNNDVESITVTGKPARYTNVTEKGEAIEAESEHMFYLASQNKLEMTTNARLKQTGHKISSQKITYDTLKRIIIAGGNDTRSMNTDPKANNGNNKTKQKQRVNITLTPEKQPQPAEESATE